MAKENRRCIDCGELVTEPHCRALDVPVVEVTLPRKLMIEFIERYDQLVDLVDGEWGPGCTDIEKALLKSVREATNIKETT